MARWQAESRPGGRRLTLCQVRARKPAGRLVRQTDWRSVPSLKPCLDFLFVFRVITADQRQIE